MRKCVVASRPVQLSWKLDHGKSPRSDKNRAINTLAQFQRWSIIKIWSHIMKLEIFFIPNKYTDNIFISFYVHSVWLQTFERNSRVEYCLPKIRQYLEKKHNACFTWIQSLNTVYVIHTLQVTINWENESVCFDNSHHINTWYRRFKIFHRTIEENPMLAALWGCT